MKNILYACHCILNTMYQKTIVIFFCLFVNSVLLLSQQNAMTVTGIVTDEEGVPLIGVTIIESDTNNGTITSADGSYTIRVSSQKSSLKFSYVGFNDEIITPTGSKLDVVLKEDISRLEEVLVIGYGTSIKKDFTGALSTVNTKDLSKAPVVTFDQALAGRVAGVQVSSMDGQPGGVSNIIIRGPSSLTQSNEPLYVVDGFPMEDAVSATINPEEIANISILKDASATAIYGARAANGVIVIETKKGRVEKPVITLNSTLGFQQVIKKMEMMNPYDFVRYQLEVNETSAKRLYTPANLPETDAFYNAEGRTLEDYRYIEGVDWQDLLFREPLFQLYNLSIRGGSKDTRYSVSGSFSDQKGIILNTGNKRYQGRFTLNQNISDRLSVGFTTNYSFNHQFGQKVNEGGGNSFTSYLLYRTWGYRPVTGNPDVNLLEFDDDPDNTNTNDIRLNPIISSENEHRVSDSRNFLVTAYLDYDVLKNLELKLRGSYGGTSYDWENFYNSRTPQGSKLNTANTKGINARYRHREYNYWSNENTLTYRLKFGNGHKASLLGGVSLDKRMSKSYGFSVQDLPNEELGMYGLSQGTPFEPTSDGAESTQLSYFGRLDYDYKSKYIFTATIRADGSSKFSKVNRWGYFPSAAIAWNVTEEPFMKNVSSISQSKVRLSYGLTGNNNIGDYQYLMRMDVSIPAAYSFNNQTPILGTYPSSIGNRYLKWETTEQFNVGYDFGMFDNKMELIFDFYNRKTRDLLLDADMPLSSGYLSAYKNIGTIQNRGVELTLNTLNIQKKNFQWRTNFNISFNTNKILALTDHQESKTERIRVGSSFANLYISRVGYPAGMFYGYVFDGIYQVEDFDSPSPDIYVLKSNIPDNGNSRDVIQPGHIKYKDMNGDNTIDANDMVIIGRGQPIHTGGLLNDLQYKNFNLSFLFQWSYGNKIYNANRMILDGHYSNLFFVNQFASYNDRWTPENRSNKYYKVGGHGPVGYQSSRVLEDGSYLRLKTLSLSYALPARFVNSMHLGNLTLFVSGQNLLTFTNYSGMDPETSVMNSILTPGYDYSAYPQARTVSFGFNMTL